MGDVYHVEYINKDGEIEVTSVSDFSSIPSHFAILLIQRYDYHSIKMKHSRKIVRQILGGDSE